MKLASKVFPSQPYLCSICPSDTAFLAFFNKTHPALFFLFFFALHLSVTELRKPMRFSAFLLEFLAVFQEIKT